MAHAGAFEISFDDGHHTFVGLDVLLDFWFQVAGSALGDARLAHIANDHLGSDVLCKFSRSGFAGAEFSTKHFVASLINLFHLPERACLSDASIADFSAYIRLNHEETDANS